MAVLSCPVSWGYTCLRSQLIGIFRTQLLSSIIIYPKFDVIQTCSLNSQIFLIRTAFEFYWGNYITLPPYGSRDPFHDHVIPFWWVVGLLTKTFLAHRSISKNLETLRIKCLILHFTLFDFLYKCHTGKLNRNSL